MPLTEPYSALFDALKATLDDSGGPFTAAEAIGEWLDDDNDWLAPSERLRQALTRTRPHCLICWPGAEADPRAGGGVSNRENVDFVIRYACGAPQAGEDYAAALRATGANYFGEWVTRKWVLDKVFALDGIGAFELPAELVATRAVPIEQPGVIARALYFRAYLLHVVND